MIIPREKKIVVFAPRTDKVGYIIMSIMKWLLGRRFTVQASDGSDCYMSSAVPRLSYAIQGMSGSHAVFYKNKNKKNNFAYQNESVIFLL